MFACRSTFDLMEKVSEYQLGRGIAQLTKVSRVELLYN